MALLGFGLLPGYQWENIGKDIIQLQTSSNTY